AIWRICRRCAQLSSSTTGNRVRRRHISATSATKLDEPRIRLAQLSTSGSLAKRAELWVHVAQPLPSQRSPDFAIDALFCEIPNQPRQKSAACGGLVRGARGASGDSSGVLPITIPASRIRDYRLVDAHFRVESL